jgi:hypothetical protein
MLLTSPQLPWILSFTTAVMFYIAYKNLIRGTKNQLLAKLRSLLILASLCLLVVVTAGVFLNNYGQFYTSWSELIGRRQAAPLVVDQAGSTITKSDIDKAKITKGGSAIFHRTIRGPLSSITSDIYISVPPTFISALRAGQIPKNDYSIVEFLPGFPGHASAWINGLGIVDQLDKANAENRFKEIIGIFPQINITPKFDAECMNIPGGQQTETWITSDVINYSNLWLAQNPKPITIVGYSTGGWCATMLAFRNPDKYSAAASIAGYYKPILDRKLSKEVKVQLSNEYDLSKILLEKKPRVSIFVVDSINDPESSKSTTQFLKSLPNEVALKEIILKGSGHNFSAWKQAISPLIDWLSGVI